MVIYCPGGAFHRMASWATNIHYMYMYVHCMYVHVCTCTHIPLDFPIDQQSHMKTLTEYKEVVESTRDSEAGLA